MLCLCVTGDDDVRDMLVEQGALAAMGRRSIVAIHSTIRPSTCIALQKYAAERNVILLDLPVSGSGHAALAKTLLVMCGGDNRAIARIVPVLECYAGTILRMGGAGAAMSAKLINNLMAVVNIGQAYQALLLGRAAGIDPAALRQAVLAGTGRTFAMDLIQRLQVPDRAAHVLGILRKDVALALEALPRPQVNCWVPLAQAGLEALEVLVTGGEMLLPSKKEGMLHGEFVVYGNA
jgi:3-hydroxyisobutyrate dehydrogenase-like beta-hydroxyacid dehydrogenase